jgi:uncharacterized protein (TIGR02271 family)
VSSQRVGLGYVSGADASKGRQAGMIRQCWNQSSRWRGVVVAGSVVLMTQNDRSEFAGWTGRKVVDPGGDKVGTISGVYADDETGEPEWLAVSTGLFGTKVSFVPIEGARGSGDDVVVGFDKATVKDAPNAEADGHLSVEEERALYAHYGRGYDRTGGETRGDSAGRGVISSDTSRRDASVVRSEEELSVGKHTEEAGRVRLRKWVETENVNVTVPVEREVARVVREPVADGSTAGAGEFVDGEQEVVLTEEVVDVSKRVVGKERIGVETDTVTEQVPVSETVRKERVGVDGDQVVGDDRGDTRRR